MHPSATVGARIGEIMCKARTRTPQGLTEDERHQIEELRKDCPHHFGPNRLTRDDGSCEECGEILR